MSITENRELFPIYDQPAEGIAPEMNQLNGMELVNRLMVFGAACTMGVLVCHAFVTEAQAAQRGKVAVELDGKLNSVVGTQKVRFEGEYALQIDSAMIKNYDKTCQYAIDPWDNLRRIFTHPNPANRIYRDMKRTGGAITKKDPYLKREKGIVLVVPKCGDSSKPKAPSQLPEWEASTTVEVKNFDNEADVIRARTNCGAFPKAWWEYRVENINPGYFDDFVGLDIRLPWPAAVTMPGAIGIRVRFGETDPLVVPICSKQVKDRFSRVNDIKKTRIFARDVRAEAAFYEQETSTDLGKSTFAEEVRPDIVELAGNRYAYNAESGRLVQESDNRLSLAG